MSVELRRASVSVCVPTCNGATYVAEAIQSVLRQTYEDFELIVVDDGSRDGTPEVVAGFADPRLRLVRSTTRLGLVGNWNRCLELAHGRHLAVFHQDDLMAPDNLRAKVRLLEKHPSVGLVYSNAVRVDADGDVLSEHWASPPRPEDEGRHDGREFFGRLLTGANVVCASSVVMRRATFERLGGFDARLPFTADWEMWLRIALFYDIGYLPQPLVRYRVHDGMETARFSLPQQLEQAYLAKTLILDKYPDRVPDLDRLRRRFTEEYRDYTLALARKQLSQGQRDTAGEFLRVALMVSDRRGEQAGSFRYRPRAGHASPPAVSILTVLEGPASGLQTTATAIQEQSFQAFEWIVVAGNIDPADAQLLEALSRADPRVRAIVSSDGDPATAARVGTQEARARHVWRVASGDGLQATALEQALWALESRDGGGTTTPFDTIRLGQPFANPLEKPARTPRVLLLLSWLEVGGVEKFCLDLIGQLGERGHQVSICTMLENHQPWFAEFARLTPDIFDLPHFLRPADFPRFLLYLIESRGIDVVLMSNCYLADQLLPFLRSRRPDVAFVDCVHMEAEIWRNGGFARVAVAHQELLDLIVVTSGHLRQRLVERGGDADRIEVCHTNVDTDVWNPARFCVEDIRRGLAIGDGVPVILYAGRIVPQKRPQLFAEVIRRLAQKDGVAFVCIVAGDGGELPALRRFMAEHGLEHHVRFVGAVTPERMQELHAAADIFFLPSAYEGLSLALYEAMAMEAVPLAADVGGQRELVTPDCGILIPHGDAEVDEYVAALRRLIEAPTRRREMATAARGRVARHFALEAMGERMVELLERAVAFSRTCPRPRVSEALGLECATLSLEYLRLERQCAAFELRLNADVARLSGEELGRSVGLRRLVQALGFRLASNPGLTWLRTFRGVGKRVLGGT